ncbi:MAG TPA: phage integrase N-terminal SAM-like domain-containing protein [Candidatus Tectomicrobia bacterium]|nr:phage integrase N-terminal SAM-like domain-containing protein [Candidatus Tectomicrobia bacterium]
MNHKPSLLDLTESENEIRLNHYSIHIEQAYVESVTCFALFHQKRHPSSMSAPGLRTSLPHHAVERRVAASTQR